MPADVAAGGGNVGRAGESVDADREVAQGGHGGGSGGGLVGPDVAVARIGDCIDRLGVPFRAVEGLAAAGELDGQACVRERDPAVAVVDGGELDSARLDAAVALVMLGVDGRDLCPGSAFSWRCRPGWLALTVSR